jgi:hypothetical protein
MFEHTESQYLSSLAHDLQRKLTCGPAIEKFGDPCSRRIQIVVVSYYMHIVYKKFLQCILTL